MNDLIMSRMLLIYNNADFKFLQHMMFGHWEIFFSIGKNNTFSD